MREQSESCSCASEEYDAQSSVIVRESRSEDRGLAPDAPDLAQGVAHLAERDIRAGGHHEQRHEVLVLLDGGLLQPCERRLDGPGVAAAAKAADALDLLSLEGRVDAEDLELGLVLEPVAVGADDHALRGLDLALVPERRAGGPAAHPAVLDRVRGGA